MGRLAAVVSHHMNPTEPSAHDSEKALAQQLSAVSTSVVEAAQVRLSKRILDMHSIWM